MPGDRQGAAVPDQAAEVTPPDVLQGQEEALASPAGVIGMYDVGVIEAGDQLHFAQETTQALGDDSHLHAQNVQRGEGRKGKYALKCANCHQETNLPGENMPPGNLNWHVPKKDMSLVFQGKSPRELADQLKDPKRNGGKTLEQLLEHVTHDKLVLWGWEPGEGRTKPPLSHAEFAKRFCEWVEKGATSPE